MLCERPFQMPLSVASVFFLMAVSCSEFSQRNQFKFTIMAELIQRNKLLVKHKEPAVELILRECIFTVEFLLKFREIEFTGRQFPFPVIVGV